MSSNSRAADSLPASASAVTQIATAPDTRLIATSNQKAKTARARVIGRPRELAGSEGPCDLAGSCMFDRTWRWAGKFRQSDKNIGCEWTQVPTRLQQLLDNTAYQLVNKVLPIDEATARFHHQLVFIHPFANGNGRHSRLMTDCLRKREGVAPFTWGANLVELGDVRHRYIDALRAADGGDIQPLRVFATS